MRFDRKIVFDGLRAGFGKKLDDVQMSVIAAMVEEFEQRKLTDVRWLSYILATGWGESKWKPVEEIGRGKGKKYGKPVNGKIYYGRGCPTQITWDFNYKKLGEMLNLDLLREPELALVVPIGVKIGFEGMIHGVFTGHKLADYFSATVDDPVNARRIINGTDKAKDFAKHHAKILAVLQQAVMAVKPNADVPQLDFPLPEKKDPRAGAGIIVVGNAGFWGVIAGWWQGVHWGWLLAGLLVAVVLLFLIFRSLSKKDA